LRRIRPGRHLIGHGVSCPLSTHPSAYFISIVSRSLGIDVDFEKFADDEEKFGEVRPHFDQNEILFDFSLLTGLELGDYEVLPQFKHFGELEVAHFVGVQNGIVKIEDEDHFVLSEEGSYIDLFLLGQGCPLSVASVRTEGTQLEEVAVELRQISLLDVLQAVLAPMLKDPLVAAEDPPDLHDGSLQERLFAFS
jgi:hypothetical protein